MAVITYVIGYRSGAVSGSPVASLYLCDTEGEAPPGIEGDLAYTKNTDNLFFYANGIWVRLARYTEIPGVPPAFNGGTITNDLTIRKGGPYFILDEGATVKIRLWESGGVLNITNNVNYTTGWTRDDLAKIGNIFQLLNGSYYFYSVDLANAVIQNALINANGSFSLRGGIYEYNRTTPQGVWQTIPYNSADFYVDGGTVTTDSNSFIQYTLIGKTCTMSFRIYNSTVSVAPNTVSGIKIRIPTAITAIDTYYEMGNFTLYDGRGIWTTGTVSVIGGVGGYLLAGPAGWPGFQYLVPGTFYAMGQIQFKISTG